MNKSFKIALIIALVISVLYGTVFSQTQTRKRILVYSTRNVYGNVILGSDFDTDLPAVLDRGSLPTLTAAELSACIQTRMGRKLTSANNQVSSIWDRSSKC